VLRFLLAFARHLGGESAVHFIATRSAPLTLSESHTAARLLRGVRVVEAAGPDPLAGVTHLRTERGLERVEDISKTAPADGGPTADDLKELTHSLYHEYLDGPKKLAALFDDLNRRRRELEEGINGFRVLALRGSTGEPAEVEINGAKFHYVWPEKPWGNPKRHGPVERGDTIEVKVSDVDAHGTPRLLWAAGKGWKVEPGAFIHGSEGAEGTRDVANELGAYLSEHEKIETPTEYAEVTRLLMLAAGVNVSKAGALLDQMEAFLRSPVGTLDFSNHQVCRAVAEHVETSVVDTLKAYAQSGQVTVHGKPIPAKVLDSNPNGSPRYVEIEGTVFTAENEREAARTRRLLERNRHHKELRHLLAGNHSAWDAFNAFQHDDWDRDREDTVEMLRAVGKVLLIQGQREEWKLVYLQLRELDEAADAIMSVIQRDKYRKNDECRFVFGEHWPRMLRDYAEQERGADSEAPATT